MEIIQLLIPADGVHIRIEPGVRADEERSGHAGQVKVFGQIAFEAVFDGFDCNFGMKDIQRRRIIIRQKQGGKPHDTTPRF